MNKNPLIFILDENNNYLRYGGTVKALEGYKDQVLVITPQTIAVGNYLSVSMMPKNANYNRYEQYVIPTLEKPSSYIDNDDEYSQTTLTWNVYKTDIKPDALTEFSKFRSGSISFAFAFQQINPSSKCVTYKGVFGVDNPLPTTGQTLGDFYECEDWDYAIESGDKTYAFSKGMYVYWNGTRWVKDRLKTLGAATSVNLPVEPNHAVGAEFDDDETMAVEDIINQVVVNGQNIATNTQDIADMVSGTKAFDEFLMSDGTSVQPNLNANQDGDIMVRDTDGNYKNSQRLVEAESDIANIEDGTTIVGKATADKNGNDIVDTYETKTNVALKVDKTQTIIGIDLQDDILLTEFKTALGNATQSVAGLLSAEDKTHLDGLVALLENSDGNTVVDTIGEILEIFNNYPEGADLVTVLNGKVDKVEGKGLSQNDFTDALKNKLDGLLNGNQYYDKNYIDALKDQNGWKSQLLTLTPLAPSGTIATATLLLYNTLKLQVKNTVTSFVDTDSVEVSLGVVAGNKIQLSDTSVYLEIGATNSTFVAPVGWTLQIVGLKYTELKAIDTTYDNAVSELTATTVQGAIDELDTQVELKENLANKAIDFSVLNDTKYPTTKAVNEKYFDKTILPFKLPNGVVDMIEYRNGKYYFVKRVQEYTLVSGDIILVDTAPSNVDNVYIKKNLDFLYYNSTNTLGNNSFMFTGFTNFSAGSLNSVDNIGKVATSGNLNNYMFVVAKGTYASLAEAKSDLAGTVIYYQLATPVETEINDTKTANWLFNLVNLESWLTPTLTGATSTYIRYRKDTLGTVVVEGNITVTTAGTNLTLPVGYRPLFAYTVGILTFNTNGTVVSSATGTQTLSVRYTGA